MPATGETVARGLHFIQMDGRKVFRFATRVMAQATREAVDRAGWKLGDVELIIPHQANQRIIESAAKSLKLPLDRFAINVDRFGNTSTASVPIATVEAVQDGRLNPGDQIVFVGFGAGLTWGAVTATWTGPLPTVRRWAAWPYRFQSLYYLYVRVRSAALRLLRYFEGVIWGRRE